MREPITNKRILVTTIVVAVAFRLFFFAYGLRHVPVSSDESWPSLMAMHMLKGEFPIVYWGQSYMGTQESAFQAVLIHFFGPHKAVVRLYPLMFGFLFVGFSYRLAQRTYNREVALLTLALLAIPVAYLTVCSVIISPDNYLALTALGSLSLLLLHDLVYGEGGLSGWKKAAALGFVLGFTFWLHLLVISYIGVALLFLFLRDKRLFLRRGFWAFCLAGAIGALPLIVYNIRHPLVTFSDVGKTATWAFSADLLRILFVKTIHFLVGMKVMFVGDSPFGISLPMPWPILLGGIWILLCAWVVVARFKSLLPLARLSLQGTDGTTILLAMAGASIFVFCRSIRSASIDVRYVLPILSVLPILGAYGLWLIAQRARQLAGVLLAFIVAMQAWGNVLLARGWADPDVIDTQMHLPDTRGLLRFLDQNGIGHAYAHFWVSYRLTFESQERLICSEPFNIRFPARYQDVKFIDEVRAADRVAYISERNLGICRNVDTAKMDELLRHIGGSYKRQDVDHFTVFYDFEPPYGRGALSEIPRGSWSVEANDHPTAARRMLDDDPATRWYTSEHSATNKFVEVDLGAVQELAVVWLELGHWRADVPPGYCVSVSADGRTWKDVYDTTGCGTDLFWEGSHPHFLVYRDHFTAAFKPTPARYVRIMLTKPHPRLDWSIAELRMFSVSGGTAARPGS